MFYVVESRKKGGSPYYMLCMIEGTKRNKGSPYNMYCVVEMVTLFCALKIEGNTD